MTTTNTVGKTPQHPGRYRLPDPPEREPDEVTSYDQLHKRGSAHYLALHFGNPETTLVEADRWMVPYPGYGSRRRRQPDLLIAFGVNLEIYKANNGYIISEQSKPPDFVLEVASVSTAQIDLGEKRDDYAALGIPEYWRFDETGQFHGARLAGDQLVDGVYVPFPIEELPDGTLQGYSPVLNLNIRWENGQPAWYDPATGRHILTYQDQRERADAAEARVSELEAEIRRLRGE